MFFKILLVALAVSSARCSDSSEQFEEVISDPSNIPFVKFLIDLGWKKATLSVLAESLAGLSGDYNATVVAYQDVHNPDGTLKEIISYELDIPKLFAQSSTTKKGEVTSSEDDDDEEDIWENMKEYLEDLQLLSKIGLPVQISWESHDSKGELVNELYLKDGLMYVYDEGLGYMNKTIRATKPQMEEIIQKYKSTVNLPMAIVKFDVDGKFVEEGSVLAPTAMTTVTDYSDADYKTIKAAIDGFTIINLKYPNEIPKHLSLYMKEKFPGYYWHVTRDTDAFYGTTDVSIVLQNELVDISDEIKIYKLFGAKKE